MSLLFDDASSQYLELVEALAGGLTAGTMAAWVYIDSFSAESCIAAMSTSAGSDNYDALIVKADATVALRSNGGTTEEAATAATLSLNTWHHVAGSWTSDTSRDVYLDGANKVNDATSETSASELRDNLTIGRLTHPAAGLYTSGRIAYVGFWSIVLTDAEIASLAAGVSPLLIHPESLVAYVPLYIDADPALNLIGTDFTRNGAPVFAVNPPGITEFADGDLITAFDDSRHTVNTILFAPTTSAIVELSVTTQTDVLFGQTLARNVELSRNIQDDVGFFVDSFTQIKQLSPRNDIAFTQTLSQNIELIKSLQTDVNLYSTTASTIEATTSNTVTFSVEAARGVTPTNTVGFTATTSAEKSSAVQNSTVFTATTSAALELGVSSSNTVVFAATTFAELFSTCIVPALPVSTSILMTASGATDLNLRGPELGNDTAVDPRRLLKVSRGGTANLFRDTAWPNNNDLSFTVTNLKETEKDDVLTFITESLGKLVTLTDQNGRVWEGIIESPDEVTITQTTRQVSGPGQRVYSASFNMVGVLQ